jgi:molybdenum cofactor cytidylyltransferase
VSTKEHAGTGQGIAGIVLAAGGSQRLGRPKQLVELDGTPLIARTVMAMLGHCDLGVICVLGAHADDIQAVLDGYGVRIIINTDWREGIATSIQTGVKHIPADAKAILLTVCDQPLVGSADFARLVNGWRDDPEAITVAGYGDDYGVPAIFPSAFRGELSALRGDRGAKSIIGSVPHRRIVDMPAAAFDIDDQDDLARLREMGEP